jgi:hypothetical protein
LHLVIRLWDLHFLHEWQSCAALGGDCLQSRSQSSPDSHNNAPSPRLIPTLPPRPQRLPTSAIRTMRTHSPQRPKNICVPLPSLRTECAHEFSITCPSSISSMYTVVKNETIRKLAQSQVQVQI